MMIKVTEFQKTRNIYKTNIYIVLFHTYTTVIVYTFHDNVMFLDTSDACIQMEYKSTYPQYRNTFFTINVW